MRGCALLLLAALTSSCAQVEATRLPVEVDMANVDLHMSDDIMLHVAGMRGQFVR